MAAADALHARGVTSSPWAPAKARQIPWDLKDSSASCLWAQLPLHSSPPPRAHSRAHSRALQLSTQKEGARGPSRASGKAPPTPRRAGLPTRSSQRLPGSGCCSPGVGITVLDFGDLSQRGLRHPGRRGAGHTGMGEGGRCGPHVWESTAWSCPAGPSLKWGTRIQNHAHMCQSAVTLSLLLGRALG